MKLLLLLLMAITAQPSLAAEATSYPASFRVEGRRIVDNAGQPAVLRGLSLPASLWLAMGEDPDADPWEEAAFKAARAWGARIIRLPVYPAAWRRYGEARGLQVLDQAVLWARRNNLYLIIDFHSVGFPPEADYAPQPDLVFGELYRTTREEIVSFWRTISRRYGQEPTVAFFELFNEPARGSARDWPADYKIEHWNAWKDALEDLIDIVREAAPNKPVIVSGLQFAYDLSFFLKTPVDRQNVVYGVHPYPDSNWQLSWQQAFGSLSERHPVFASEFGFGIEKPENAYQGKQRYREAIISFLEKRGIGWTVWAFSGWMAPPLLKAGGGFHANEAGAFFRSKLLEKAKQ